MHRFALVLDSPDADGTRVRSLLDALRRANPDDIPLIVVSSAGTEALLSADVEIVERSSLLCGLLPGSDSDVERINRERIAMSFWETGLAEHYVVLPPDLRLLRDVRLDDFWHESGVPYSFLSEDPEASVDPGRAGAALREQEAVMAVARLIGLDERRLVASRDVDVLSSASMRSLKESVLDANSLGYAQALEILPSAGTWHGLWLLKSGQRPVVLREPLVRRFLDADDLFDLRLKQVKEDDLRRGYLGVLDELHEAWSDRTPSRAEVIASRVSIPQVIRVIGLKALNRMPRVSRALGRPLDRRG